jgi:hypothetical protein
LQPSTKENPKFKISNPPLLPGATVKGQVVFMTGLHSFYIQPEEWVKPLESLMGQVATVCKPGGGAGAVLQLDAGDACFAKFPDDSEWYRARVSRLSS